MIFDGFRDYKSAIGLCKFNMADGIWHFVKYDLIEMLCLGVCRMVDYKFAIGFSKFDIRDPIYGQQNILFDLIL